MTDAQVTGKRASVCVTRDCAGLKSGYPTCNRVLSAPKHIASQRSSPAVLARSRHGRRITSRYLSNGIGAAVVQKFNRTWQRSRQSPAVPDAERNIIITACETFINDFLKPRFLPNIAPTEWNYLIDIHGDWRAGRYRFIQRYRSGMADNRGEEFDAPFARLDRMAPDRFDIQWIRHTGTWWRLYDGVTLTQAFHILEADGHLHPL